MLSLDLKPSDLAIILEEKDNHPHALVRRKLLVLHLKNLDISTELISKIVNVSLNTVRSYIKEYNSKGLSSILTVHFNKPVSELNKYKQEIKKSFESEPPSTIAEAKNRIEQLTGIRRSPTQIRIFLKSIGARPLKVGVIPGKAVTEAKKKSKQNFLIKN